MSDLIPYQPMMLARPKARRSVAVEVARAEDDGVIAASQLQIGQVVASVAMFGVQSIAGQAEAAYRAAGMGEEGYHAILNAHVRGAVAVIDDLNARRNRR